MEVVPKLVEDDASSVVSSMDGSTYGDYGMTGEFIKEMIMYASPPPRVQVLLVVMMLR